MYAIVENSNRRLSISFATVLTLHVVFLWMMNMTAALEERKVKIISNVELLQPKPLQGNFVEAPKPENVWQRIKSVMPLNRPGAAGPKESPLDSMRKITARVANEPKLMDRQEPLPKPSELASLRKQRDAKLGELMEMSKGDQRRMQQLLVQEQSLALTDRKAPIARPAAMGVDKPIGLAEVGFKRADKSVIDIAQKQEKSAAAALLKEVAHPTKLTEKREELRRKLASLGTDDGLRLSDSGRDLKNVPQVNDIVGSLKERKKAQEILALQNVIKDKDLGSPTGGGDNGWGKGSMQYNMYGNAKQSLGREDIAALKEAKESSFPASSRSRGSAAAPNPTMLDKMKKVGSASNLIEVGKKSVELSGPIAKRKVLASYVPKYPDWAARKGIEADVMIRFYVNPAGAVMPNITVVKTSGYSELDQISIEALKQWVFAPLGPNEAQQDQWGIITIRFELE